MKSQNELYRFVYDYYVNRILSGYYKFGDSLPPVAKICASFQLSVPTVRTALALLEKDRYIKIMAPKAAKIIYKASQDDFFENFTNYMLARREGLADLIHVNQQLLGPLLDAGIRRWEEDAWSVHWQEIKNNDSDGMSLAMRLYMTVLASLENDLVLNFFWEINRYIRLPYLCSEQEIVDLNRRGIMEALIKKTGKISRVEIASYLTEEMSVVYKNANFYLFETIQSREPEICQGEIVQIPFEWNFYHKRSQIRYSLGAQIIQEILDGYYPVGSYLPSLPRMAKHYQVSLITIRRALAFLGDFGVVRSYQGKGTQVCLGQGEINLSQNNVQLALKYFLESFQFLALTIRSVCRFTLGGISDESFQGLLETLNRIHEREMDYLIIDVFLTFITEYCPSPAVSHCYHKLAKCLAVGYPFFLPKWNSKAYKQMFTDMMRDAVKSIECHDIDGMVEQWGGFFDRQEQYYRTFAAEIYGKSEDLRS